MNDMIDLFGLFYPYQSISDPLQNVTEKFLSKTLFFFLTLMLLTELFIDPKYF